MKSIFSIIFSNYTAQLFTWKGSPKANKKYLGNRSVVGTVNAGNEEEALALWKSQPSPAAA